MGPVPPDFNLDTFIGCKLFQVCIDPNGLQFHFDREHSISGEGRMTAVLAGISTIVFDREAPRSSDASPLPRLICRDVVSWRVEGSHEFSITLADEAHLRFQSSDSPYEDFVIFPGPIVI